MDITDLDTLKLKTVLTRLEFRSLLRNLPSGMRSDAVVTSDQPEFQEIKPANEGEMERSGVGQTHHGRAGRHTSHGDELVVSHDPSRYSRVTVSDIADTIGKLSVVTHDGDALCRFLLSSHSHLPYAIYDTKHAAFLLDPLRKSRELGDLTGTDTADTGQAIVAIWALHAEQNQLAKLPMLERVARDIDFPLIPLLAVWSIAASFWTLPCSVICKRIIRTNRHYSATDVRTGRK